MKLIITVIFMFFGLTAFSQAQAIKMKHYSWNNPQHHFNEVLTENGKALLDSIKLESGFDTLQCDRLNYEKIIYPIVYSFIRFFFYRIQKSVKRD